MPASISEAEVSVVKAFLKEKKLKHLRCRQRAATVILESGPQDDALGHLRLRKLSATTWAADEFHHSGRWAPLPVSAPLAEALRAVASDFSWLLDA
jgi:hypothetical protein